MKQDRLDRRGVGEARTAVQKLAADSFLLGAAGAEWAPRRARALFRLPVTPTSADRATAGWALKTPSQQMVKSVVSAGHTRCDFRPQNQSRPCWSRYPRSPIR